MPAQTSFDRVREKLKLKQLAAASRLTRKHPKAVRLLLGKGLVPEKLREHSMKLLAGATLASALLSASGSPTGLTSEAVIGEKRLSETLLSKEELAGKLSERLKQVLPGEAGSLTAWQEEQIDKVIFDTYGVKAVAELEGNRLNDQFGWMGAEQHLKRFLGDHIGLHDEWQDSGIAPGLGAWGYFNEGGSLSDEARMREKYYVAVQTLYLSDWNLRFRELRDWYKYRKVVVVNPENGKAVVAVVGDSGPAAWTGKVFGGSPEVMEKLNLHKGPRKGKVVLLFIDDPEDKVPLGELEYNLERQPLMV